MAADKQIEELNNLIMEDLNMVRRDTRVSLEALDLVLQSVGKSPKRDKLIKEHCDKIFKLRLLGFGDNQPKQEELELLHTRATALAADNGLIAELAKALKDPTQSIKLDSMIQSISFALPMYMCKVTEDTAAVIKSKVISALQEHNKHTLVFESHAQRVCELIVNEAKVDSATAQQLQTSLIVIRDLNERLVLAIEQALPEYDKMSVYLSLSEALYTLCCSVVLFNNLTQMFAIVLDHITITDNPKTNLP